MKIPKELLNNFYENEGRITAAMLLFDIKTIEIRASGIYDDVLFITASKHPFNKEAETFKIDLYEEIYPESYGGSSELFPAPTETREYFLRSGAEKHLLDALDLFYPFWKEGTGSEVYCTWTPSNLSIEIFERYTLPKATEVLQRGIGERVDGELPF